MRKFEITPDGGLNFTGGEDTRVKRRKYKLKESDMLAEISWFPSKDYYNVLINF